MFAWDAERTKERWCVLKFYLGFAKRPAVLSLAVFVLGLPPPLKAELHATQKNILYIFN